MKTQIRTMVCALGMLMAASSARADGTVTYLGYLPNDNYSRAYGVSGNGQVVVGTSGLHPNYGGILPTYSAFRWTAGTGMVGLGFMSAAPFSTANAANADGAVVVGEGAVVVGETFRWVAGLGMQALPNDASRIFFAMPRGVSADGNTIVGVSGQGENGEFVALLATFPASISARPSLSIKSSSGRQLVLSWPTNYTGFTLQSSTNPASAIWTNCSSPSVSVGNFVITNPMSAGVQLFRLKK